MGRQVASTPYENYDPVLRPPQLEAANHTATPRKRLGRRQDGAVPWVVTVTRPNRSSPWVELVETPTLGRCADHLLYYSTAAGSRLLPLYRCASATWRGGAAVRLALGLPQADGRVASPSVPPLTSGEGLCFHQAA